MSKERPRTSWGEFLPIYYWDRDFFNNIDTPIKAYWLGFIVGESHRKKLEIGLSPKDEAHLRLLLNALRSTSPVYQCSNGPRISCGQTDLNRVVSEWMQEAIEGLPHFTTTLTWHFLRGFVDADGSIGFYTQLYRGRAYHYPQLNFAQKSRAFILSVKSFVNQETPVKTGYVYTQGSCCHLCFRGYRSVIPLLGLLYQDSTPDTRLARKWVVTKEILSEKEDTI